MRAAPQLDKRRGWLGGVCAGLAGYAGVDAAWVRIGVVVTALFMPKLVLAAYLIAWFVLDERKSSTR